MYIRMFFTRFFESLSMKLAWRLPPRIVSWCYVRVVAYGTSGEYGGEIVPDVTAMDIYGRYLKDVIQDGKPERSPIQTLDKALSKNTIEENSEK